LPGEFVATGIAGFIQSLLSIGVEDSHFRNLRQQKLARADLHPGVVHGVFHTAGIARRKRLDHHTFQLCGGGNGVERTRPGKSPAGAIGGSVLVVARCEGHGEGEGGEATEGSILLAGVTKILRVGTEDTAEEGAEIAAAGGAAQSQIIHRVGLKLSGTSP
jgi:hypothetical protein